MCGHFHHLLITSLLKKYFRKHNNYEEETQSPRENGCVCLKILPSNYLKVRNWVCYYSEVHSSGRETGWEVKFQGIAHCLVCEADDRV
jgi:hypothetical protein